MRFRSNNPAPAVLQILAEFRLCIDDQYRGEVARLFDNRGYRRLYYKRSGLTIDGLGEVMLDRGIVAERPSPREILDYLDDVLRPAERKKSGRKRASADSIEAMERRARNVRSRLYECACGQKVRGTRETSVACGRCLPDAFRAIAEEVARITSNPAIAGAIVAAVQDCIPVLRRIDPLPEEILGQSFATMSQEGRAA